MNVFGGRKNANPNVAKAALNDFLLVKVVQGKRIVRKCETFVVKTYFYWSKLFKEKEL